MANRKKFLRKEQIVAAQGKTLSNISAARYLHVSYQHYKKYAKMYNLFDDHKNQAGKGIPKYLRGPKKMPHMKEIIEGRIAASSFNPNKLKYAYILTPKGVAAKTKITLNFMKRKMKEYDELKAEIGEDS